MKWKRGLWFNLLLLLFFLFLIGWGGLCLFLRVQDLINSRQLDRQNLQNAERRLGEERRQKQSIESQLANERKQRKLVEERASRTECGDMCKMKKQQLEMECNKYRRDLAVMDDAKNLTEQQNRSYEQEVS